MSTLNNQSGDFIMDVFERIRQQNASGIKDLYENYSASLYGQILKVVPDEQPATEILQDVFLKIWKNIDSYNASLGRPYTWMVRIARNRAIDYHRSARAKRRHKTDALPDYVANSKHLAQEQHTDAIGLRGVVAKLSPKHQELIDFLYFREYSQSETADALGIPLGTVKTRSRKAMQELRKHLSDEIQLSLIAAALLN